MLCGPSSGHSDSGAWDVIPTELLARVLGLLTETTSAWAAVRATCSAWRTAVDSSLLELKPTTWPSGCSALSCSFPRLRALNLLSLRHGDNQIDGSNCSGLECAHHMWADIGLDSAACSADCSLVRHTAYNTSTASALNLVGAFALQTKPSCSNAGDPDCVVAVKAGVSRSAMGAYVASRWPEAAPVLAPMAAMHMWRDLPRLCALQSLAINGSMLLVQSLRTLVDPSPDAAGHHAAVHDDSAPTVTVTHIYSLALPPAVVQLTQLQSLTVHWRLLNPGDSDNTPSAAQALHGNSLVLPSRRRSYEGNPSPEVLLVADPQLRLPSQFSKLSGLRQLELAASFAGQVALRPLAGLTNLTGLTLGPGELDMQAVAPLAAAGTLQRLQHLVLKQQGAWDARAVAAVLAGSPVLQDWEVHELELSSGAVADAAIPPDAILTAADTAPVQCSLTRITWTTCSQRLSSGSSLLGRTPVASPASTSAAGAWLSSCTALRALSLSGDHSPAVVLNAAAVEVLSDSVANCSSLEELSIHGLGVPLLPSGLSQLQQLHSVTIASTSLARRAMYAADGALAVLGSCSQLRSLTLAGCELRQVPSWLTGLQQLTQLQLHGNYIQELRAPGAPMLLPASLQVLNLSDNRLRDIPASIASLSRLSKLQLNENYLSSLPEQVWQLPELQELSAKENMLPELPEPCGSSRRMASDSRGSTLSTQSAFSSQQQPAAVDDGDRDELEAMGVLTRPASQTTSSSSTIITAASKANGNSIQEDSSRRCSGLKVLVLADNQLAQLPASITLLTGLQHLDLSHNQLHSLPESGSIWALTHLTSLNLGNNHFKKIPPGIARLQRLATLDVSGNHLPGINCKADKPAPPHTSTASISTPAAPTPAATSTAAHCSLPAALGLESSRLRNRTDEEGNSSSSSSRDQLPSPLRALQHLKQLRLGGQQVEQTRNSHCPLAMLLGGLADLVELLRSLAPPGHQCPVTKAAQAAVAHFSRVSNGKRAKRERERALLACVQSEPGWVVLPAPKAGGGLAAGAAAGAAAVAGAAVGAVQ